MRHTTLAICLALFSTLSTMGTSGCRASAFADAVTTFSPAVVSSDPDVAYLEPANALGAPDLWIYEAGPGVEDTFVEISRNGIEWFAVGKVFGSTSSIDIDAFGFGIADRFSHVRLTDDAAEGGQSGSTVGANLDAVEALSSVAVSAGTASWGTLRATY